MAIRLTPTSFIVLGFLARLGEATPYDLKAQVEASVGNFWSFPHSQLYAEPARLAKAGLLQERRERGGRRRRIFSLTSAGREALERWRDEPTAELPELRDLSLLKLFFDGEPVTLALVQAEAHRSKLAAYETLAAVDDGSGPRGPWRALEAGIAHEREWIRFWEQLGAD
jgi:DNA-binding PadR family transcriptional regulator